MCMDLFLKMEVYLVPLWVLHGSASFLFEMGKNQPCQ